MAPWKEWRTDCADGWSHHGLATVPDGIVVGYHPLDRELLFFDADGSVPCEATEAHDIAVAPDGVADLVARVTVLDIDDRLVAHLASGDASRDGWPNALAGEHPVPPPFESGRFNSPHGITTAGDDVVVTEWCLGGRWVRLAARPS